MGIFLCVVVVAVGLLVFTFVYLIFCIFGCFLYIYKKSCLYYGKTCLSLFFFFSRISGRKSSSATLLSEFMPWRGDVTEHMDMLLVSFIRSLSHCNSLCKV